MIILSLIQNIALLVALAAAYQVIEARWQMRQLTSRLLHGFLFGVVGLVGMMTPAHLMPGIIFDGRSIILSVGGLFGGPIVALIAALMCGAYRLWLGGAGAAMGTSVIVESAALGVVFHYWRRRTARPWGLLELWGFGLSVHAVMLGLTVLLPGGVRHTVRNEIGLAIVGVYPVATMLICRLFLDYETQRRDQAALREKTKELDHYFMDALDLLCIADTDGHFRRLNKEWESTLGYSLSELEGRRFADFVHPDDVEATLQAVSRLAGQKEVLNFVNRYRCKDGSYRWIEWRSFSSGTTIYAVARDITGRKQTEEKLKERMEELLSWENVTLGREARILELKKEVNDLLTRLGKPPRYVGVEEGLPGPPSTGETPVRI
jgi:PAS domain S-box-containing protein